MTENLDPKPGSYASLERRVEALETGMANVRLDLAVIQTDVRHQSELSLSHYKTIEAQYSALSASVGKIDSLIDQALRDPSSVMPQQKVIADEWAKWRGDVDKEMDGFARLRDQLGGILSVVRWLGVGGIIAAVIGIAKLFGVL